MLDASAVGNLAHRGKFQTRAKYFGHRPSVDSPMLRLLRRELLCCLRHGQKNSAEAIMNEIRLHEDPITRVRKKMEVITADGRCAGHVSDCIGNQIFMSQSLQTIPREW